MEYVTKHYILFITYNKLTDKYATYRKKDAILQLLAYIGMEYLHYKLLILIMITCFKQNRPYRK